MSFIPTLVTKEITSDLYSKQMYDKAVAIASAQFDANVQSEVIVQLKKYNIVFASQTEFENFAASRLTKITISGTQTTIIALDAVIDSGTGAVTDFGTELISWTGLGYEVRFNSPYSQVTTFSSNI